MKDIFTIDRQTANKIFIAGKPYDFFSGTSYLGMSQEEAFRKLLLEGINQYGMSFGSSRNGNLQLAIYEEAEEKLAQWIGSEKVLTLSSGMLAGQLVVQYLKSQSTTFFYAPQSHAATFYETNINLPNSTFEAWTKIISQEILQEKSESIAIVCNACDALKLSPYNFGWIDELPDNKAITLIIDDSHGLGINGIDGSGIYKTLNPKSNIQLIIVSSLNKAMGIAGGLVAANATFIEELKKTSFFSSCSPIAPAYLDAYLKADTIYEQRRIKLSKNIKQFIEQIGESIQLFQSQENYPVFYTSIDQLYSFLFEQQILIYSFAYPITTGKPNTRIVISAWHTTEQIKFLAEKINDFFNRWKS